MQKINRNPAILLLTSWKKPSSYFPVKENVCIDMFEKLKDLFASKLGSCMVCEHKFELSYPNPVLSQMRSIPFTLGLDIKEHGILCAAS
jgi:hypothetical protein